MCPSSKNFLLWEKTSDTSSYYACSYVIGRSHYLPILWFVIIGDIMIWGYMYCMLYSLLSLHVSCPLFWFFFVLIFIFILCDTSHLLISGYYPDAMATREREKKKKQNKKKKRNESNETPTLEQTWKRRIVNKL